MICRFKMHELAFAFTFTFVFTLILILAFMLTRMFTFVSDSTKEHQEKDEISQSIYISNGIYRNFNILSYDHTKSQFEIYSS